MAVAGFPQSVVVDAEGGTESYTLINTGMTDLVFKIRTSNNTDYMFKPVHAVIKSGTTKKIEVIRKKGPPKSNDKFVIQYAAAPASVQDPQAAFSSAPYLGQLSVGLHALA